MINKDRLFLSPKEVEDIYGIKFNTLAQWRCLRIGPTFYKVGRSVKYRITDIEKWLEEVRYENSN